MLEEQKIFVNNLKYYRKINSISQQKLAELCNVSVGTIGNIESYITKPSFDLIINISKQLNITPDLLFRKETPSFISEIEKKNIKKFLDQFSNSVNNSINQLINQINDLLD